MQSVPLENKTALEAGHKAQKKRKKSGFGLSGRGKTIDIVFLRSIWQKNENSSEKISKNGSQPKGERAEREKRSATSRNIAGAIGLKRKAMKTRGNGSKKPKL